MSLIHHIASGQAALAAETAGSGSPVLLLHAGVCDRRMWRAQQDGLDAHNTVIAYDRRGFGATQASKEDYSSVEDLKTVIDAAADGAPAILVGCSQGGGGALDMALRHPAYVRALILIAPNVSGAPSPAHPPAIAALVAQREQAQKAGDPDRINAIQARILLDGPLQSEGRVKGAARDLFLDMNAIALRSPPVGKNLDDEDAFHRLDEIKVPALVLWGEYDATGRMLNGVAHVPSLERPAEVTSLIAEFVDRLAVGFSASLDPSTIKISHRD
jgi:pimeloyl-ACP methyl ester carboxylesterase